MGLAATWDLASLPRTSANEAPSLEPVADFPRPLYSKKQVVKAGKTIIGPMPWSDERADEYRTVFKIAYDWRASHAFPMRQIRQEMSGKIRTLKARGVTAARMKRMSSIRKKLLRLDTTLAQIQDIGGCRAIVESQATLDALLAHFRSDTSHNLRLDRSYVESPRTSGYRCHHLVLDFIPANSEEEVYRDRRIEVQLRTRMQHSWATAVEAMGLYLNEDLKGSEGDADWLRFFELVSSEFAEFEGAPAVPHAPPKAKRIAEISALDKKLTAISTLETINQAFNFTEKNTSLNSRYFMIQFDHIRRTMEVVGYDRAIRATERYGQEEVSHGNRTTVVVEVDKIEYLRDAFPNYFLDVRLFTQNVVKMMNGEPLVEALRRTELAQTAQGHNLSWLSKYFPGVNRRN